jgi:quinoprotein relay system zinc metallohydrolase 2
MKKFVCIITILALPLYAAEGAQDSGTLQTDEIAPGIFVARGAVELANEINHGAISNRAFVVGSEAVAVIDTGGSFAAGQALKSAILARTQLPVRYVVNTHMHPDHVLGNAAFKDAGTVFAGHAKLPRALAARHDQYLQANQALIGEAAFAGTQIIPPALLVEKEAAIDLGGRMLRLTAHATAHTDNDLTVLDETTGTLFLGDLVFVEHLPVIDGSLNGWLGVMEGLEHVPAARAVPGHGPASISWPEGAKAQRRYLTALRDDLRAAVRAGWPLAKAMDTIRPQEAENWRLIGEFHKRNISAAFSEMEWE